MLYKALKTTLKSIAVAFGIYSKIPMPKFEWGSDDMKYHMCFFPWVGILIGGLIYGWYRLAQYLDVGHMMFVLICAAIPILVTGGFHIDGYMDTMDALHSYGDKEKKLEILKDPHIGAFAVIMFALYGLVYVAFLSELVDSTKIAIYSMTFFLSRCLSGISVMMFHSAKSNGMLSMFSDTAEKRLVVVTLVIQFVACATLCICVNLFCGSAVVFAQILAFLYYRNTSYKNFGGVTGDLAGFFVCIAEIASLAAVVIT